MRVTRTASLWFRAQASNLIGHRGRAILGASMWSVAAKGCAALNVFVSVPFVLHALGARQFGAWAALVALPVFAGFLDFGFGYGAMNLVASARGRESPEEIRSIVRMSRTSLLKVAIVFAVLSAAVLPWVPWFRLLGLDDSLTASARNAVAVVMLSIVCAIPLNVSNRLQLGVGRGDSAFRWQALGQIFGLVAVAACAYSHATLPTLAAAATLTPLFAAAFNTWSLEQTLHARSASVLPHLSARIWHEGSQFFVVQLSAAVAFSADLPLITALRGSTDAGVYAIAQRFYSVIPMVLSLLWAPLWPIYRQALAAGDRPWATRTLRRSASLAVGFAAISAVAITLVFKPATRLWVGKPIDVNEILLAGLASWCVLEALGTAIATYLNAASYLRLQVVTSVAFAVVCLAGKIYVIHASGIDWIPWITIVSYLFTSILPLTLLRMRIADDIASTRF